MLSLIIECSTIGHFEGVAKDLPPFAGDSHSVAVTSGGAVYSWGLFRGENGPMGFLPGVPHALEPRLIRQPRDYGDQIMQISSGMAPVILFTPCPAPGKRSNTGLVSAEV